MATVVSVNAILTRLQALGWTAVQISDVVEGLAAANIPAAQLIAYLTAAQASPDGFNDQTISGVPGAVASEITGFLQQRGAVTV